MSLRRMENLFHSFRRRLQGLAGVTNALTASLGSLLIACIISGCGKKALPRSFADATFVTVSLNDPDHEMGLLRVEWGGEGHTVPAKLAGIRCRCLKLQHKGEGYVYFRIDSSFKQSKITNARLLVEYFDSTQG